MGDLVRQPNDGSSSGNLLTSSPCGSREKSIQPSSQELGQLLTNCNILSPSSALSKEHSLDLPPKPRVEVGGTLGHQGLSPRTGKSNDS